LRTFAPGDRRLPRPGIGPSGGRARPHPGASGAIAVHVSPRNAVGTGVGRGFRRACGGCGAGDGIARTRRVAADPLGIEWASDPPFIGVGGTRVARLRLPVSTSPELADALGRGSPRARTSVTPRLPAKPV